MQVRETVEPSPRTRHQGGKEIGDGPIRKGAVGFSLKFQALWMNSWDPKKGGSLIHCAFLGFVPPAHLFPSFIPSSIFLQLPSVFASASTEPVELGATLPAAAAGVYGPITLVSTTRKISRPSDHPSDYSSDLPSTPTTLPTVHTTPPSQRSPRLCHCPAIQSATLPRLHCTRRLRHKACATRGGNVCPRSSGR